VIRRVLGSDSVLLFMRLLLGAIFVYAAYDKLLAPADFAKDVYNYKLLPGVFVNFVAVVLPPVELVCGLSLILGVFNRGAALLTGALLAGFLVGLVSAAARGLAIDCGCFGSGHAVDLWTIARDVLLFVPALLVLVHPPDRLRLPRLFTSG
jgi:uncharacterized membrane protein YphA (DoxX/SURF4 family)